ncbi:MAG TPA: hypothetical protein VIB39_14310 [Candidatus Angelobacter sp.]|jgi:hypothetical protein
MRNRFRIVVVGLIAFLASLASAQTSTDRIKAIQNNINNTKTAIDQLPDNVKVTMAGERGVLERLGSALNRMAGVVVKDQGKRFGGGWQPSQGWEQGGADENGLAQVNNPARDARFSPFLGFTQNNAVTARCGENVVVAFEDSASAIETLFTGQGGVSFVTTASGTGGISSIGYATSHNGGITFKDRGAVNPGPNVDTMLFREPAVACSDPNHFYLVTYAFVSSGQGHLAPLRAILLSQSSDGGDTWSDPVTVAVTGLDVSVDRVADPWIAIDPSNHKRVYISYTHVVITAFPDAAECFGKAKVEVVSSTDGGNTFDPTPREVDSRCFLNGDLSVPLDFFDMGTRMAVSSNGRVTVAWLGQAPFDGVGFVQQAILVNSFTPGGPTPASVTVDNVFQGGSIVEEPFIFTNPPFPTGIGNITDIVGFPQAIVPTLQGGIYNIRGFDLAVDHSGGATDGTVYLLWDDARNGAFLAPEFEDIFGSYNFTDIMFAVSTDGGQTFTSTRQLNSDTQSLIARGHDHFRPTAAVDRTGKVAACWYDRRNDPQNYQFERFCAESTNGGTSWTEFRIPGSLSTPVVLQDVLLPGTNSMGENDSLTTDFSGRNPGFIGGFQWMSSGMNPDVKEVRFP